MVGLARFCVRNRFGVLAVWVLLLVGMQFGLGVVGGADYRSSFSLDDTDSQRAFFVLGSTFPDLSGVELQIVMRTEGPVTDPATEARVEAMLAEVGTLPHVSDVESPFDEQRVKAISDDKRTAFAQVKFNQDYDDIQDSAIAAVIDEARTIESPQLRVELGGQAVQFVEQGRGPESSTMIGLIAAVIVLLISFGSLLAMGLPVLTAVLGLGTGIAAIGFGSQILDFPEFSQELALMVGLGVGVDYALFILTRFRDIYRELGGPELPDEEARKVRDRAIELAMDRAGRAVVFAGITVIIAFCGMFALGFEFLNGVAIAISLGVLFVLGSSLTVLPALLGIFGRGIGRPGLLRRRQAAAGKQPREVWGTWIDFIQRHRAVTTLAGTLVIVALSVPALFMDLGTAGTGYDSEQRTTRQAYDLLTDGFGAGYNAPLLIAMELPEVDDRFPADQLAAALRSTDGIASVDRPRLSPGRTTAAVTAYPTTSPQSEETADLVRFLRRDVVRSVEANSGARIYVGGQTAQDIDFTTAIAEKLFLFIGIVVALSALLLLVVFRSFVIPVQAAILNVLSIGGALGVVTLVFGAGVLGGEGGPIEAFLPVMVFAIVFGLSMDYEVFLVSRIHEEWLHTRDHSLAVRTGLATTGRVITAAAAVMIVVFASFVVGTSERIPQMFGVGLATAIFLDAFLIRVVLLPSTLALVGPRTWWFPAWLDRLLPTLAVEPPEDHQEPRQPWGWRIRAFWAVLLALLIAGGTVWAVLADEDEDEPKTVKVLAERGPVIAETSAPGSITDPSQLAVNFPSGGRLRSVLVEPGDRVEKGDVLAVVEGGQARGQLRAAQSQRAGAGAGRRTGGARRDQSATSVAAAQDSLRGARRTARAMDRSVDSAYQTARDGLRRAKRAEKRARKGERRACSGRQTLQGPPDGGAAAAASGCDAAQEGVRLAERGVGEAEAAVKAARRQREVGKSQTRDGVQQARNGVAAARRGDQVTEASTSADRPPERAARAQVRSARQGLNRTKLKAPADGVVVSVGGEPSEYVGSPGGGGVPGLGGAQAAGSLDVDVQDEQDGEDGPAGPPAGFGGPSAGAAPRGGSGAPGGGQSGGFVILTEVGSLEATAVFSENAAAELRVGQEALVTVPALEDEELRARLSRISPSGTPGPSGVGFTAWFTLIDTPADLKVGQTSSIEVTTGRAEDVIYIPTAAIRTSAGRSTAAIIKRGVPRLRRVELGVEGRLSTEIRSGIKAGDKVILGTPRIEDD